MDIKIQTKRETFLIFIENLTIRELKCKLNRLGIELKDIVIYFYDNDSDKIVIIDDKDVGYAFQQGKIKYRNRIKFYIYYKLKQPKINKTLGQIQDQKELGQIQDQKELALSDQSETIRESIDNLIIFPFPIIQKREETLKNKIENYIDTLLREQYEI
ncbi:unnamed protein product [Paramecium primaurelia]|uniref:Uncharacterized protein n=1 Tax=Paramecium primaurelia TaxID=5886 RepID=A0A8S1MBK0_PARPR|nr:unnamed protein product [Paramecium primaurelia]